MLQFPKEPKNIRERIRSYGRVLRKERESFGAQRRLGCRKCASATKLIVLYRQVKRSQPPRHCRFRSILLAQYNQFCKQTYSWPIGQLLLTVVDYR